MNPYRDLELFTEQTCNQLFHDYQPKQCLVGELSSSALATAIALFTLEQHDPLQHKNQIEKAHQWLENSINSDGGFGDSPESLSNISTSLLVLASINKRADSQLKTRLEKWLIGKIGDLNPHNIQQSILSFYGEDKTFSAPILTMCCLAGMFDKHRDPWSLVPQLPFELACLPHSFFKVCNLNVVSYALPALIAVGLCRHRQKNSGLNIFRHLTKNKVLKKLQNIQPSNGGFLEATPLTGFVCMCLIRSGEIKNICVDKGVQFLVESMRGDGSWPIDSNLSTWVSSLAIKASIPEQLTQHNVVQSDLQSFYLNQQLKTIHPYTMAEPGGWAWTDLPGGVPDADDTAAALLVLSKIHNKNNDLSTAAEHGFSWLQSLQNSDGGIPTFCKGWGKLPFDKSCPDISAHVLEAIDAWQALTNSICDLTHFKKSLITYLIKTQHSEGYWLPLWFGSQHHKNQQNPVYGTAQVLGVIAKSKNDLNLEPVINKAKVWLMTQQNEDGSWGLNNSGFGNIEETSLALTTLLVCDSCDTSIISKGYDWLLEHTERGTVFNAEPIGLYFASLWYSEKKYPLCFLLRFLNQLKNSLEN